MEDQKKNAAGTPPDADDEIDLVELAGNFFRIAKRVWWLFVALVAVGIGGMYAYSYIGYEPLYRCEATFTISTGDNSSFYYNINTADQMSLTFPYILDSSYFRSVLLDTLGVDELNGTLSASTITNSNMVTMRADSPSAEDARAILDAALQVYPEVSRFVLGDIEFHLIDEIQTPTEPYNQPSLRRVVGYGGLGGLALAVLIVGLMALFSNTIKTVEDMEKVSSLECFAVLPETKQKARKNSAASKYLSVLDPRTTHGIRESIRSLTSRSQNAMQDANVKTLLVTSSVAGEGKSTVAINLAEQLAQNGARVLLVDLDLRRQQDAILLNCSGGLSVAEVLRDRNAQKTGFIRRLKRRGFYFWGGKKPVNNPTDVLSDRRLRRMLDSLREQVDYLILDAAPCGLFQDAAIVADWADAALMVVRYDTVTKTNIAEALSMLDSRQAEVIGYVLNAFPQSSTGYGYGYGRYGYGKYGYGAYGSKYSELPEEEVAEEDPTLAPV